MLDKKIARKLAHLTELINSPSRKEGSELRIFHELFLMTHNGEDLSPDTLDWLNESASLFLSPDLLNVLSKLRLVVYGFKFAALRLIDIEDVIDELSNGKILKDIHYLPPGAFNKLKRELLPGPQHYSPDRISRHTVVRDNELIPQQSSAKHRITQPAGFTTVPKHHSVQQGFFGDERAPKPEASTFDSDCISADDVPLKLSSGSSADVATTKIGSPSTSGMICTTSTSTDPSSPLLSSVSDDTRIKCGKPSSLISSTPSHSSISTPKSDGLSSYLPSLSNPSSQDTEEVVYCHRAKLFCFSNGEWKEQGVGNVNILRRTSTGKTRFLMRREGDLKMCLNHALTSTLSFRLKDDRSWFWTAKDFSGSEEKIETFVIRFRDANTAKDFMAVVFENQNTGTEANRNESTKEEKSIENDDKVNVESRTELAVASKICNSVKPRASLEPAKKAAASTSSFSLVDPRFHFNTPTSSGNVRENEGKDDAIAKPVLITPLVTTKEENSFGQVSFKPAPFSPPPEEVEETVMFEERCTLSYLTTTDLNWVLLGTGNIKIVYDDDMLCCRITVQDGNQQYLCDYVIAIETKLKIDNKECVWSYIDYSSEESFHRTFRAQFTSRESALEFKYIFAEGKQFAEKLGVHDEPDEFYRQRL